MPELKEKLDILFLQIVNEEAPLKAIKAMLDEMTIGYSDVAYTITPFLERLEDLGAEGLRYENTTSFFYIAEILQVFIERYFNIVKENGYYKTTRIRFDKNWLCLDCNNFFDVREEMKHSKLTEISCTHCNSKRWHNSNEIKRAVHDHKLN